MTNKACATPPTHLKSTVGGSAAESLSDQVFYMRGGAPSAQPRPGHVRLLEAHLQLPNAIVAQRPQAARARTYTHTYPPSHLNAAQLTPRRTHLSSRTRPSPSILSTHTTPRPPPRIPLAARKRGPFLTVAIQQPPDAGVWT